MANASKKASHHDAFNQALLGLTRLGIPLQSDDKKPAIDEVAVDLLPQMLGEGFRNELMDVILAKRPGLTREKLSRQMAEMGF